MEFNNDEGSQVCVRCKEVQRAAARLCKGMGRNQQHVLLSAPGAGSPGRLVPPLAATRASRVALGRAVRSVVTRSLIESNLDWADVAIEARGVDGHVIRRTPLGDLAAQHFDEQPACCDDHGGAPSTLPAVSTQTVAHVAESASADGTWAAAVTSSKSPDELRRRVKLCKAQVGELRFDLARDLHEIYRRWLHKKWGFRSFSAFATSMKMHEVYASRLRRIWAVLVEDLKIDRSVLEPIGYSKLAAILPVVNEDNVDEWLERARTLSKLCLEQEVKVARAPDGSLLDDRKTITAKLHPEQFQIYQTARKLLRYYGVEAENEQIALMALATAANRLIMTETSPLDPGFLCSKLGAALGGEFLWVKSGEARAVLREAIDARPDLFENAPRPPRPKPREEYMPGPTEVDLTLPRRS